MGPGPVHGVLVSGESFLERRRVVRLDAVDHDRLLDGGVDPARVLHAGSLVQGQLLVADFEDLGGVQAVERPQPDELVVGLRAEGPALDGRAHGALERVDVGDDRRAGRRDRLVQAGLSALVQHAGSGGLDLVE